jgi:hypothetical protein
MIPREEVELEDVTSYNIFEVKIIIQGMVFK